MDEGEKSTESPEETSTGSSDTSEKTASTETGDTASAEESTAGNASEETLDNIFGSPADPSIASTSSGISKLRGKNPMLDTMLDTKTENVKSPTRNDPPSTEDQGTFKVPATPTSPMRTPKKKKPLEGLGAVLLESHRSGAITKSPKQKESLRTHQPKSLSASGTIRGASTSQSGKSVSPFESALRQFRKAEEAWDYSMKSLKAYEKQITRSLPEMLENVRDVATPTPDELLTCIQAVEEERKLVPIIDLTDSDSNSPIPSLSLDAEVSSDSKSALDTEISSDSRSALDTEVSSDSRSAVDTEVSSDSRSALDTEVSSDSKFALDTEVSSESRSTLDMEEANESRSAMDTEEVSESKSTMDTDEISESLSAMDTEELSGPKSHMEDLSESKSAMDTEDFSESRSDMDTEEPEPKSATDSEAAGQVVGITLTEEGSPTDNLPVKSRKKDLPTPEKSAEEKRLKIISQSSTQHSQESIAEESDIGEETSGETVEETPETPAVTSPENTDKPKRRISSETSLQKASKQPRL